MPRRLLRDGRIVEDDWVYLGETDNPDAAARLIVPFDRWRADRDRWLAGNASLGVVLLPAHRVEDLVADIARLSLVAAEFTGPSDGRGYTQARLLRERYSFSGELRASGYVRFDQVFFMARCGFNGFELPDTELEHGSAAFATFTARYQPTNDAGLPIRLQERPPAGSPAPHSVPGALDPIG